MQRVKTLTIGVPLTFALLAAAPLASGQDTKKMNATREVNLRAYVELLRSDLRSQKVAIITEMMQFSEAEDAKFWPIYREYETELAKVNDQRIALIEEYAAKYDQLTDAVADKLARGALDVEAQRHTLKTKFYDRFASALSPKTAARFLQVENQILLLLDLQIAASLPVVE